jgi:glutamyl-tRNA reductase
MSLTAFGLNYQTAPLAIREKIAFGAAQLPEALNALLALPGVQEAAILSTCNRTEIYCNASQPEKALDWLVAHYQLEKTTLLPYLYRFDAADTARHAFRVACGLDSMVLGEAQILGQLKEAVRIAQENGALGSVLNGLFQRAFQVAKEVRTQTQIGSNSVSMAAACVRLAERIFPTIEACHVLFIGAGKMITLCATYFAAQHPKSIRIANRTQERGEALAQSVGGQAILLTDLPEHLAEYDIVISSTASTLPIVGKGMIEGALRKRRRKPIFMVDLAVPRDIEAEAGQLNDVYLYTVDDLASLVEEARDARALAALEAESIIDVQVASFVTWLQSRAIVPTIRDLKDSAERIRRNELIRAKKMLANGALLEDILESLSQGMMNKYLHAPLMTLHQAAATQQDELINLIRRIYHLHDAD